MAALDYTSAASLLTGAPATRREPTTDRIDCSACLGVGFFDGPGPLSTPCKPCAGTGGATCREPTCREPATLRDSEGPVCEGCAVKCFYGCDRISTQLVNSVDDSGEPSVLDLCDECAEEESEHIERRKRAARRAKLDDERDGYGDALFEERRDERGAA